MRTPALLATSIKRLPTGLVLASCIVALWTIVSAYIKTFDKALTQERIVSQVERVDAKTLASFSDEQKRLQQLPPIPDNIHDPFTKP